MSTVIISVVSVGIISLICGVLLVIAARFMAVEEAPLFPAIRNCLPGANCGACGYAGCDGYARALASGEETRSNLCIPGAAGVAAAIAEVMGCEVEAAPAAPTKMALVFCGGDCVKAGEPKACEYGCVGCGECAAVCPMGAISIADGLAVVSKEKCVGCGLCANACPKQLIRLVPASAKVYNRCSNPGFGKEVLSVCKAGCIGCAKCSKLCSEGAVTMDGKLAVVDYEKCVGCGSCAEGCPTKSMTLL